MNKVDIVKTAIITISDLVKGKIVKIYDQGTNDFG